MLVSIPSRRAYSALIGAVMLLAAGPAFAKPWSVDAKSSAIRFSGDHAGTKFNGGFTAWTAQIEFDPAQPEAGSAAVMIDLASARTGNKQYDATLPDGEWLASKATPKAEFRAQSFTKTGANAFLAKGALTIRGKSLPVELPFNVDPAGKVGTLNAKLKIDRTFFGIGATVDPKGEWVSKIIDVEITLTATAS